MAKSAKQHGSIPGPTEAATSKFGVDAYAHAGSGDVKLGLNEPGLNILPDGRIALTRRLIAEMAEASEEAMRRQPQQRERG